MVYIRGAEGKKQRNGKIVFEAGSATMAGGGNVLSQAEELHYVNKDDGVVADGLLCFLVNKMKTVVHDTIIRLITATYKGEEIEASKKKLFDLCGTSKNVSHKGEKKDVLHVRDMIKLLQEKGTDIPTFVCKPDDLDTLTPISFDNIDVSVLLTQIQKSQDEMAVLKANLISQNDVIRELSAINSGLDVRMKRLERQHDDPFYRGNNTNREEVKSDNDQTIPMTVVTSGAAKSGQDETMLTDSKGTRTEVIKRGRRGKPPTVQYRRRPSLFRLEME